MTVTDVEELETVFVSDLLGRRTQLVDPNAGSSEYAYDADGRVTQVASSAHTVTRNAYLPYGALRGTDQLDVDRGWLGQLEDAERYNSTARLQNSAEYAGTFAIRTPIHGPQPDARTPPNGGHVSSEVTTCGADHR